MDMTRRGLFAALAAAFTLDPEQALWVPGKKLISIPKRRTPMKFHQIVLGMSDGTSYVVNDVVEGKPFFVAPHEMRLESARLVYPPSNIVYNLTASADIPKPVAQSKGSIIAIGDIISLKFTTVSAEGATLSIGRA